MSLSPKQLQDIVDELAEKPGHEKVKTLTYKLLTDGLGMSSREIDFEKPIPEANGRLDAIIGRTLFEFKRDLVSETSDAEEQMERYLPEREQESGQRFIGIVSDGSEYAVYGLGEDGKPYRAESYKTSKHDPNGLLTWLSRVSAFKSEIPPDFENIHSEFGKDSVVWREAEIELNRLWNEVSNSPDARLKYRLWQQLLGVAYGSEFDDLSLFLRHTYLTILAKSIAWAALIDALPQTAEDIVSGSAFAQRGIKGLGGEDFFGWIANTENGDHFVRKLTAQASRFRFHDASTDVMKGLYESLIDPEERHDLGEYYTPDWLAARICKEVIQNPLTDKILDPSCGSGTFVFHAVRLALETAKAENKPPEIALRAAASNIVGLDIHPVATTVAQVTFLLAILPAMREATLAEGLSIPIYLGDALQWWAQRPSDDQGQSDFFSGGSGDLTIAVPAEQIGRKKYPPLNLVFPLSIMANIELFDETITKILEYSERQATVEDFKAWMRNNPSISTFDYDVLASTYKNLKKLHKNKRNHIWGFVSRNLARPIWLSENSKVDILIGNPPWVAFRYMTGDFQKKFKKECEQEKLWVGGEVATHQDLSAYFFAKTALLYLKPEGKIAFLLPNAALSRKAYELFRKGHLRNNGTIEAAFRIDHVWSMKREIGPLFPVPSCAIFATKTRELSISNRPLPSSVKALHGKLPYRDASETIANARIRTSEENWPKAQTGAVSPYAKGFQQGATLVPRRFALVKPGVIGGGRLGSVGDMPQLVGRKGKLDKEPWKSIQPPTGKVENSFLRTVLLGSSITPFRVIDPETGVIPVADISNSDGTIVESVLLDSQLAMQHGFPNLSNWMENAEKLWDENSTNSVSLIDWWNYRNKLMEQFPIPELRVVYAASGTHMAATIVEGQAIIDSSLYWARIESLEEAHYLVAILNCETAVDEVRPLQSQGLWGPRHFSKYVFETLWPRYKEDNQLHQDVVDVAKEAEQIASSIEVPHNMKGLQFINVRKGIRNALAEHGVTQKLNELTRKLLDDEE